MGPRIRWIGIPTCDRPFALRRCVLSYARHLRRHGRECGILVADDSQNAPSRDRSRAFLNKIERQYGVICRYFGAEEKDQLVDRLTATGINPDLVRFAISNPLSIPSSPGGNRNLLLLLTSGEAFLSADDDSVCLGADLRTPDGYPALVNFAGVADRMHVLENVRDYLGSRRNDDLDLIGLHEEYLGAEMRELAKEEVSLPLKELVHFGNRIVSDILSGRGRVSATVSGILGDSGLVTIMPMMLAQGDAVRRFAALSFDRIYCAGPVVIGTNKPLISAYGPMFTSTATGFDNTELLPSFVPSGRGEDTIWGQLLNACRPCDYIAQLPVAMVHNQYRRRRLLGLPVSMRFADIIGLLIRIAPNYSKYLPDVRMNEMGKHFCTFGTAEIPDLERYFREASRNWAVNHFQAAQSYLSNADYPVIWRSVLSSWTQELQKSALHPQPACADIGLHRLRDFLFKMGELLVSWPAIREGCLHLRSKL